MKQAIQEKLTHITHTEPLHFLLAVESGSRAWGFASPDSDYDVRAIYIRPQPYYLQIDEAKDTFEFIENQWFDVGGWDIRKALRLLRKSNATLLEWLRSPIIYTQDDDFTGRLNALAPQYVQAAALLHHYRGIAGNALKAMDLAHPVKLKKWFYVLRPLLAARWAVKQGGIPPMTLAELMSEWQTDCAAQIADLVAIKAEQDESYLHTLSPELQRLTVDLYNEVSELSAPAAQAADSGPLNELFRETLAAVNG